MLKCICEETKSVINTGDSLAGFSGSITCPIKIAHDEQILAVNLLPHLVLGEVYIAYTVGFFGSIIKNTVSFDL